MSSVAPTIAATADVDWGKKAGGRPRVLASRWSRWAMVGIAGELAASLVLWNVVLALAPGVVQGGEAGVALLASLPGFVTFGAIAVVVSIDLNERYAAHFGQDIAELVGEDDPVRDRVLGLIVLELAAAVTGLVLESLAPVPSIAVASAPAVVAILFITALISYVAGRFRLLRQDEFRGLVMATLTRRLGADRRRVASRPLAEDQAEAALELYRQFVFDFELMAELTIRLLERGSEDAARSTFADVLHVVDEHADERRAKDGDLVGPVRLRPGELGAGDAAHRVRPDWIKHLFTGPATPTAQNETPSVWFEDVATEVLAAVLRVAVRRKAAFFLIGAIGEVARRARVADPLVRQYFVETLCAVAREDRAMTEANPGSDRGIGETCRSTLARALVDILFEAWLGQKPARFDRDTIDAITIDNSSFCFSAIFESARAAGDKQFATQTLDWLQRDWSEPWGMVDRALVDQLVADYTAFRGATSFERIVEEAVERDDVAARGAPNEPAAPPRAEG